MDLNLYQKLVYIITDIAYVMAVAAFIYGITQKRLKNLIYTMVAFVGYAIIDILVYFYFSEMNFYIIATLLQTFVLIYIFSREFIRSIVMASFWVFYTGVCESVSVYITSAIVGISIDDALGNNMTYTVICSLTRLFLLISALVFYKIKQKDEAERVTPTYWAVIAFTFVGTVFIIEMFYSECYRYLSHSQDYKLFAIVIVLIVINILIFYLYEEQAKHYAIKGELELLKNHMYNQKIFYDNERKLYEQKSRERHDMTNFLIALEQYIEEEEYDNMLEVLDEKLESLEVKRKINSNNKDIDTILDYKIAVAQEKGINVETEFGVEDSINIETEDLIVLLGNAMDNAIEAAERSQNPYIYISIKCENRICSIVIRNAVEGDLTIKENDIKTTKQDSGHGWGIRTIKNLVQKYNGELELTCEKGVFTLKVFLQTEEM